VELIDKFKDEHEDVDELIQEWWQEGTPFTPKCNNMFLTHNMMEPYRLLSVMI
jgi:hypothetical protein